MFIYLSLICVLVKLYRPLIQNNKKHNEHISLIQNLRVPYIFLNKQIIQKANVLTLIRSSVYTQY